MPVDVVRGRLDLLLQALLASGPGHEYGLIGELRGCSGGFLKLSKGSIYPALHHLEQTGLIKSRSANTHGRGEKGACGGCWCMCWRVPRRALWDQVKGRKNRENLRPLVTAGKVHAVIAYTGVPEMFQAARYVERDHPAGSRAVFVSRTLGRPR